MTTPILKRPLDRFFTTLTVSVILGFGAGAVGALMAAVYFSPPALTVTVSPVPKASMAVNRVESKRLVASEAATRAAVIFFEAKTPDPLKAVYLGSEAIGAGMTLTSDGWIIAQADGLKTAKRGTAVVARVDGRLYAVTATVHDPYSDSVFFKIEARDLPVVAMAKTTATYLPGDSLFGIDAFGGVRRLEIANLAAPASETAADLVHSSERLTKFMMTGAEPALPVGSMVLSDSAQAVGLVSAHGRFGTLVTPIDAWDDVIDSVLKGRGPVRPYLGVNYLDLAESGAVDADGRPERGAQLAASADGKTPAVAKGSPADKAGLRAGDVILTVNGESVSARRPLSSIIAAYIPDMNITVSYRRAGFDRKVDISLAAAATTAAPATIDKKP